MTEWAFASPPPPSLEQLQEVPGTFDFNRSYSDGTLLILHCVIA